MAAPIEYASHRQGPKLRRRPAAALDLGREPEDRAEFLKRNEGIRERAMIVRRDKGPPLPPGASNMDIARRREALVEQDGAPSRVVENPAVNLAAGRPGLDARTKEALRQQSVVMQWISDEEDRLRR